MFFIRLLEMKVDTFEIHMKDYCVEFVGWGRNWKETNLPPTEASNAVLFSDLLGIFTQTSFGTVELTKGICVDPADPDEEVDEPDPSYWKRNDFQLLEPIFKKCRAETCPGCIHNCPGQKDHMMEGGCLYQGDK
jgi:hypothetical protein